MYSNTAYGGGGLALEGILNTDIERSQFYSNTAVNYGGAISNIGTFDNPESPLNILDSSLHDNFAGFSGGAIDTLSALLVISNTVLNANHAGYFGGAIYAAYFDAPGSLTVVNSTLSGNVASQDGAGLYAIESAKIWLFNDTIAANVLSRPHLPIYPLRGGGVFITDTAVVTAQNTLTADNRFIHNLILVGPDDCFTSATTTLHSLGYNLVETTTNCTISGDTSDNITDQDPVLGPLQNNGGATQTQPLLVGSPAIDAAQVPTPGCTDAAGTPLTTDQRGFARPGVAHCDIGALEYYPLGPFLPLIRL